MDFIRIRAITATFTASPFESGYIREKTAECRRLTRRPKRRLAPEYSL